MGLYQPKSEEVGETDGSARRLELADIFALLLKDPFWLTIDQIWKLTPRQIWGLYFRPRPDEDDDERPEFKEPETDEEIEASVAAIAATWGRDAEWVKAASAQLKSDIEAAKQRATGSGENGRPD